MFGFLELRNPQQWSPTDKDASFSISNNGLTINGGGGGTTSFVSARAAQGLAINQKLYIEFTVNALDGGGYGCGFANPNAAINNYLGADSNGITYYSTGVFSYNGTQSGTPTASTTVGDVCCVAIDGLNQKFWVQINAAGWNGDVLANQNPATNTGGFACGGVFVGKLLIGVTSRSSVLSLTLNAGSTAFVYTPPSGFRAPNSTVNV